MSAFGAYPAPMAEWRAHFVVSSSNKCIEGVPGFSFALCEGAALRACKGNARSLSLDLHAQWAGLASNGQFRFTPPTHALLAFASALAQHEAEGGAPGRLTRYANNHAVLLRGAPGASAESLEDMIDIAITECERFYPAFQFVLWGGKSPAEALQAAMLECVGEA